MFARLARSSFPVWKQRSVLSRTLAVAPVFAHRIEQWNKLCPPPPSQESPSNATVGDRSTQSPSSNETNPYQLCYVNNQLADIDSMSEKSDSVRYISSPTKEDAMFSRDRETRDFFKTFWHSSSHIMAYALEQYYGDKIKLIHGPSGNGVPYCFFYEVALTASAPTDKDLKAIQKCVNKILKQSVVFQHRAVSKEQALQLFSDNPYKCSIIEKAVGPISVYKCGDFIDLCRGPHIHSSAAIASLKVTSANNVEAKDDPTPHYRFYGNSFVSRQAEETYAKLMKEAKERDHRLIGKKLELFMFDENSPGNVFFLNRGLLIYNRLVEHMRTQYLREYEEIASPLMFRSDLWRVSGHYDHYKQNMFHVETSGPEELFLKPMNCPSHCLVYKAKTRSYRDLPLRYAEFTAIHRQENSGALGGLTRLNMFHQDDGHIFCRKDQITAEIGKLLSIIEHVYSRLGFRYSFVLSTQPKDSVGQSAEWSETEAALKAILEQRFEYSVEEGDGAFYAPKIDVLIQDSICRYHQCGTIQLDVQLPKKFGLKYRTPSGEYETPVLIHRAIYGSLERFMGVFIEHCNGRFPLAFSPYQVALLPVSSAAHYERCKSVAAQLMKECGSDLHVDVLTHETSIGKRIRECSMKHYNYMVAIGDEEMGSNTLSVRSRGSKQGKSMAISEFSKELEAELRSLDEN